MGAFAAQTVMRAMRWRSLFARDAPAAARGRVMAATLIGYLFNNVMPARAGEVARVVALTQRTGHARRPRSSAPRSSSAPTTSSRS